MRISRIYLPGPLESNQLAELPAKTSHYLLNVLRLKPGDPVIVFNGNGYDYHAELHSVEKKSAALKIHQAGDQEVLPDLEIHLGIGLSKGDRLEFAFQKATELGVTAITPLYTEHTAFKLRPDQLEKKILHWQGIVHAACEQSGRSYLPSFHDPLTLAQWLPEHGEALKIVLAPQATTSMKSLQARKKLVLLVGPEGGLSAAEISQAEQLDFKPVHLGRHILRTETAPLAAIAAAQTLWGSFG